MTPLSPESAELKARLREAAELLARSGRDDAWSHRTVTEFSELLQNAIRALDAGPLPPNLWSELRLAFAPTSDWDDLVGDVEIGNAVSGLLERPEEDCCE